MLATLSGLMRRHPYALALLVLVCIQFFAGDHPALNSTVRYNLSCEEMVTGGDWLVPHLGGTDYMEKPPLTYWLGAICMSLLGVGDRAAHAAGALCMLAVLWCSIAIARRWWGRDQGGQVALVVNGSLLFIAASSLLTTDPVLSAALGLSWWAWGCHLTDSKARYRWLFWVGIAFGWLAKGPVALALAGAAVFTHTLMTSGWRGLWSGFRSTAPLRGLLIVLAANLPWTLAVWWRDPRLIEFFYLVINVGSIANPEVNHPEPLWFYAQMIPGMLMPWGIVGLAWFGVAWWKGLRSSRRGMDSAPETNHGDVIWRTWMTSICIGPLVFLSLVSAKLPSYLLPMLPAFVLLMLDGARSLQLTRRWTYAIGIQAVLFIAAVAIALPLSKYWSGWGSTHLEAVMLVGPVALPLFAGWAAWALCAWHGRHQAGIASCGIGLALALAIGLSRAEQLKPQEFPGPLVDMIGPGGSEDDLIVIDSSVVHEYQIDQRLHRRPLIYGNCRERGLGHWIEVHPPPQDMPNDGQGTLIPAYQVNGNLLPDHPWLLSDDRLITLWNSPQRVWMFVRRRPPAVMGAAGLTWNEHARRGKYVLICNRPRAPE